MANKIAKSTTLQQPQLFKHFFSTKIIKRKTQTSNHKTVDYRNIAKFSRKTKVKTIMLRAGTYYSFIIVNAT